ncbi:CRISPR-associated helicase Cas3' [Tepidiphilus sp. HLB4]
MVPWGKADVARGAHLALVDHALDVSTVFRHLTVVRSPPGVMLSPVQIDRLSFLAFLHDFGKCNRGFQAKVDPSAHECAGHVIEGLAFLVEPSLQCRWPSSWRQSCEQMCSWFLGGEEQLFSLLLATLSHHGRPLRPEDVAGYSDRNLSRWWTPSPDYDPIIAFAEFVDTGRCAFSSAFTDGGSLLDADPTLQHWFAGLLMLADWIGSDTRFFPYPAPDPRLALADQGARHALKVIGLAPPAPRPIPANFTSCFSFAPSPLQCALLEEIPIEDASRLMLAESETGSGKTEAALAWFSRLYAAGEVDGLYFALPTRVAARELYGRVFSFIERAFPEPDRRPHPVLLAVPGYVKIDGEAPLPPSGVLWEDDGRARLAEQFWAAEHPKRFLAAPIGVGTIDQALLSALAVRHALLRSVCLDRHLLVVDEVHASSPYMREILKSLITVHRSRGGWTLLLSATLGEAAWAEFFRHPPRSLPEATDRPYPSLTTLSGEISLPSVGKQKSVAIEEIPQLDEATLLPRLKAALAEGARVLVVCNTVRRAVALQRLVEADAGFDRAWLFHVANTICPHHGRFAREDREVMDAEVSKRLGKDSADGPLLLIGTQTLEQSLDIDADLLITDLCPIDVLLQRIGRLHRHRRQHRPLSYAEARVLVRTPGTEGLDRFLDKKGGLRAAAGLGLVYEDGRILQCTAEIIRRHPLFKLPDENRALVEAATHPAALAALEQRVPAWRSHAQELFGRQLQELRSAETSVIASRPFGELHYPDKEARILTRLGMNSIELPLQGRPLSPLGIPLSQLSIPAHLLGGTDLSQLPTSITPVLGADGFRFTLGMQQFRYTRFGLEKDDDV